MTKNDKKKPPARKKRPRKGKRRALVVRTATASEPPQPTTPSVDGSTATVHWLLRPETIRSLWFGGILMLVVLVAAEAWVHPHGYFRIDGTFSFNAWFGFAACVAMIVVAKALGAFLKRKDTYYDVD